MNRRNVDGGAPMRSEHPTTSACRLLALLALCAAPAALAQQSAQCEAPHEVDRYQLLRRLSLDLRGRMPSVEEYQALDGAASVPTATVDAMLASDEFRLAMRRYHEALFWPNLSAVRLHGANSVIAQRAGEPAFRLTLGGRTRTFRLDADTHCGDFEQTHFDPAYPGQFRPDPAYVQTVTVMVNGAPVQAKQEGWRYVTPYWDPTLQLKVCAFDAQETPSVTVGTQTVSCASINGNANPACGCGPNLASCWPGSGVVDRAVQGALREQLALSVDQVTTGGKPYTDLLLSTQAQMNGPIAHFKKYLAPNLSFAQTFNLPDPQEQLSPKPYTDAAFEPVDRKGLHAGVVTLPGYLLRFQTDRSRANRFRIDFLCEYFVPPATLAPAAGCSESSGDLTARCNCQYCHKQLEPLAAHWAFYAEAGTTQMTNGTLYPRTRPACVGSNAAVCNRFYVTQPDAHNPGALLPLQWMDEHPDFLANAEGGPRLLAKRLIDDGSFAQCTVKKAFAYFTKRPMRVAGEQAEEKPTLDRLAQGFKDHGYSFPWLVKELVSLPQYRRVR